MIIIVLKGILLGIMTAAPVGPIGMLIADRTLKKGRLSGISSGLGAAFADGVYATLAVFSVGAVSTIILSYHFGISLFGSIVLLFMGYRVYASKVGDNFREYREHGREVIGDIFSTFFLAVSNPTLIVSFSAVFGGFGLKDLSGDIMTKIVLIAGFILGSFTWFYILSTMVNKIRNRFTVSMLEKINHFVGIAIMTFATAYFISNFVIWFTK